MAVWIAFAAGGVIGTVVGVVITCLMVAAGRTSRETEEMEALRELS